MLGKLKVGKLERKFYFHQKILVFSLAESGILTGSSGTNIVLRPSRNPKGSNHKGLGQVTLQATDRKSSPHNHPAQSTYVEERRSTSDERLDKNEGESHPAA
jgi:hypothetical protein